MVSLSILLTKKTKLMHSDMATIEEVTTKITEVDTLHNTEVEEEDFNLPGVVMNQLEVEQAGEATTTKIKLHLQHNLKEGALPAKEELIHPMEAKTWANGAQIAKSQLTTQHNAGL